jgi:hypothetical protein
MPSPKQLAKEKKVDEDRMPETFVNTSKSIKTIVPDAKTAPKVYDPVEAKDWFVNRGGHPVTIMSQGRWRRLAPGKRVKRDI